MAKSRSPISSSSAARRDRARRAARTSRTSSSILSRTSAGRTQSKPTAAARARQLVGAQQRRQRRRHAARAPTSRPVPSPPRSSAFRSSQRRRTSPVVMSAALGQRPAVGREDVRMAPHQLARRSPRPRRRSRSGRPLRRSAPGTPPRRGSRRALRAGRRDPGDRARRAARRFLRARTGRSDCSVCSRSHGQPPGARSVRMIRTSSSNAVRRGVAIVASRPLCYHSRFAVTDTSSPSADARVSFVAFLYSLASTAAVHFGDVRRSDHRGEARAEPRAGGARHRRPGAARREDQGQPHQRGAAVPRAGALRAAHALRGA